MGTAVQCKVDCVGRWSCYNSLKVLTSFSFFKMSIPRFSALMSTRKVRPNQSNNEKAEQGKIIQAETFGQITNQTVNYSYSLETPKENLPYIFGAGNLSDLMRAWPEGNWSSSINSNK